MSDPDWIYNLLASVEVAVASALVSSPGGLNADTWRRIIGWADPPEDCCPEIAVWASNIRPNPAYLQNQGGQTQRATCTPGWLIDINVRVSVCYVDTDAEGGHLPPADINESSDELYRLWWCLYFAFWCRWVSGSIMEVDACTPLSLGESRSYAGGGCAGVEFAITVSVDQ